MNDRSVLLTILIPSYNHEDYIEQCLLPLLNLNLNKKILIIDDGSTDNSSIVINKFISEHSDINIEVIEKNNGGLVSSLNLGLSKVNSKYLYIIASDDIPNPRGIEEAVVFLEKHKTIDFFIGGGENFFQKGLNTKIYNKKHCDFFSLDLKKREKKIFLDYPSPILLQSTIFKTQCLKNIRGWDEELIWDDYPLFVKLLTNSDINFIFQPTVEIVFYRHHGHNTYKNINKQFFLVNQSLNKLAPQKIKKKSIGNALGYYMLKAILQGDFLLGIKLWFNSSLHIKFYSLLKMIRIVSNKLLRIK